MGKKKWDDLVRIISFWTIFDNWIIDSMIEK